MSRYTLLRKRIAPIAFLLAIGLLVRESCTKQQRTHATIVIDLGDAERNVRSVDASLVINGDSIATFHRIAAPGLRIGTCKFAAAMPADDVDIQIDVDLAGTHKLFTRHIHADEGAIVTLPLGSELR